MTFARNIALTFLGLVATVILLFPVYWMLMTAVMPTGDILSRNPPLLPDWSKVSFKAFVEVFERRPLLQWMANTFFVSGISTLLSLVVSTLAGYSLSRWRMRLQQITGATLLLSKLIPSSLIIIPLFIMFNAAHLDDSFTGLILANMAIGVPLATWLMKGFFDRIPAELEQAAMIDGCSRLSALWYVILPLTRPGLASAGIYLLIVSWSEFIFARTLITSDSKQVFTVGLQSFVGEYQVEWSNLMAAGSISLVPVIILFLVLEPFLVSGLTKGALAN
ncbi:carbohydrate ABC transporter permease [Rhizobium pusense]|uniref:carbohydrate ABC transporter permease n=1 Tax=Agrobacterium pusense TaxID=648995 RepID=UPI001C6E15C0|nr:carbohydrate ABC transporter permease [Agrobacterium pusense]MBW9076366.1 carbohydrate ABC transporter permease [Agrobacterium pusense]